MRCYKCGKEMKYSYGGKCQGCYNYYKNGGVDNPLPELGRIRYDYRGCVICHMCGRAFKRLGSHVKESHDLTIAEYKRKFELCNTAKTTEKEYSEMMHNYAYENDMHKRIKEIGKGTRIQKGDGSLRKGKQIRLQERLNKADRMKKECSI